MKETKLGFWALVIANVLLVTIATHRHMDAMWLKIFFVTALLLGFADKIYYYSTKRVKHIMTWVCGLLLVIPFMMTDDFIILFASLVGFSLGLYTFILSDYSKHAAREASVKYFYLSAVSVSLILFAIAINYLVFETMNFKATAEGIMTMGELDNSAAALLFMLLSFFTFGFFFKIAAYPGHLWAGDVYEGAPNAAFAFFALPAKIATLTVFVTVMAAVYGELHNLWQPLVLIGCIGSLIWGCFAAVYERKLKRFVAYTSVNQIGFLLLGLAINEPGSDALKYTYLYLAVYAIMSFALLLVFVQARPTPLYITDFNAFYRSSPFLGAVIILTMFAMAGIPPLAGFWGKYYLLLATFQTGYALLLKIALIVSLISTFYYIRVVKVMLFENLRLPKFYTSQSSTILVMVSVMLMIGFVVFINFMI